MENRVPIPTDNIFKFYALFGFVLFVSCIAAFLYLHKTTNDLLAHATVAVAEIEAKASATPADVKRREVLEKQVEVTLADKDVFVKALGVFMGIALILMVCGFYQWHYVVQPKQDKLLDLQIAKAEQEQRQTRKPFRKVRGDT